MKLFEFYNFPDNGRDSQITILDYLTKYLTVERAMDSLKNEVLSRIVKAYKVHHPTMSKFIIIDLSYKCLQFMFKPKLN